MKIHFESNYKVQLTTSRKLTSSVDIPIEEIVDSVIQDIEYLASVSKEDIEDSIDGFISDFLLESNSLLNKEDQDNAGCFIDTDEIDYHVINNADIYDLVLPLTSHLITEEEIYDCCQSAPKDANFCPTCGKRLR